MQREKDVPIPKNLFSFLSHGRLQNFDGIFGWDLEPFQSKSHFEKVISEAYLFWFHFLQPAVNKYGGTYSYT